MNRLLICALALASAPTLAQDFAPFTNNGALARSFALPALGRELAPDDDEARGEWTLDLINEYHSEGTAAAESITLDGEAVRLAYGLHGGFADCWEWSLELPLYVQGGGFGDDLIEGWHETFGLPNGGRELAPQDRYQYQYIRNNVTQFDIRDDSTRAGDVTLGIGRALGKASALRLQFKLPTGDSERLSGGNAGAALWLDTMFPAANGQRFSAYLSGGVSVNDHGELIPQQQRRVIGFGGLGLRARLYNSLHIYTQFYLHSPLYSDSDTDALSRPGLPTAFGLNWNLSDDLVFDLAFQEDLSVSASPDFSLRFGLRSR